MLDIEKRQVTRVLLKNVVQFLPPTPVPWAEILNLSLGGMFLRGGDGLEVGQSVRFRFYLKELDSWVAGKGIVCWQRSASADSRFPGGFGVAFTEITAANRFLLDQYLNVSQAMRVIGRIENRHVRMRQQEIEAGEL